MPQSLSKIYLHCVFSTKYRRPLIKDDLRDDLYAYVVGTLFALHSYTVAVGAHKDHIHFLCTLPRTSTVAELISKVKTASSKWFKKNGVEDFSWQNGYAAFSVSSSVLEVVKGYIQNQDEHHRKKTFQKEYKNFLDDYGVEYNEQYVWD
ncbi:MAG: IS200/IS605 family transposase [Bacteroidales bacterium]|nr:IS200/IS605 family transposase [Bacteroidales bacterium]